MSCHCSAAGNVLESLEYVQIGPGSRHKRARYIRDRENGWTCKLELESNNRRASSQAVVDRDEAIGKCRQARKAYRDYGRRMDMESECKADSRTNGSEGRIDALGPCQGCFGLVAYEEHGGFEAEVKGRGSIVRVGSSGGVEGEGDDST